MPFFNIYLYLYVFVCIYTYQYKQYKTIELNIYSPTDPFMQLSKLFHQLHFNN